MQIPQGFKMARAFIISAKLRLLKSVRKAEYNGIEFVLKSHFFLYFNVLFWQNFYPVRKVNKWANLEKVSDLEIIKE